jgi:hypothetical protein
MKKSQIAGQIFVYVLSLIIIGLIVLFGYRAVNMIMDYQVKMDEINFMTRFEEAISKTDYKDVEIKTFKVPGKYRKICLVSQNHGSLPNIDPLPLTQWTNTEDNVLLYTGITEFLPMKVSKTLVLDMPTPDAVPDPDEQTKNTYLCKTVQGSITLRLEGLGSSVFVSEKIS